MIPICVLFQWFCTHIILPCLVLHNFLLSSAIKNCVVSYLFTWANTRILCLIECFIYWKIWSFLASFLNHKKKKNNKKTLMLSLRRDGKRAVLMKKCAQIQHMRLDKMCSKNKGYHPQRDGMGREEGGGFRMGNTCIPVADSFWYLAKLIELCKV